MATGERLDSSDRRPNSSLIGLGHYQAADMATALLDIAPRSDLGRQDVWVAN